MLGITRETWGYVATGGLVILIVAALFGSLWVSAHRPKDPAFAPEWRCTHPEEGEVCQRVQPPPRPKSSPAP
jgi:hypothetical protein